MSVSIPLTRSIGQMASAMRLLVLTLLFVVHFIFVACDTAPVEEEQDTLQTAKPDNPVVVTTDDQVPPEISLNSGAYPTGIIMDTSPIVNFTSNETGDVYITANSGGNCPAKLFLTKVTADGNNCVELYSSSSTARSITELVGGSYDCRLVMIDPGGNQDFVDFNFTIVSPTSQAGDLLNNLQDNMSGTTTTTNSTCSSNSSQASPGRNAFSSNADSSGSCDGCEMTAEQSSAVLVKVAEDLKNAGLLESSNLLDLIPKMVEYVQKNLKEASLGQADNQTTRVVQDMLGTLISSMKGREAFMIPSSAEPGMSVQTTLLKNITQTSVSNLAAAFETHASGRSSGKNHDRSASDLANDAGSLIGAIVGAMGKSGVDPNELGSTMKEVTGTAVASLENVEGMDAANLGDALQQITSEATSAISKAIADVKEADSSTNTSDLISTLVSSATSGATENLGKIDIPGFSSDDLSSMVENVTKGATSGLGELASDSDENIELSSLVSEISASATESLDEIEMPGFNSDDLSSILESVAKGASEGLENVETSNPNDKLALLEKIQEGTTEALGEIEMPGFDADEQKENLEKKIKKGTSSGFVTLLNKLQVAKITNITSTDSDSDDEDPTSMYKEGDEITIELTFNMPVAFSGGGASELPYLEIDSGTNRKTIRENPDLVRKAEWIGSGSNYGQKGTYNKKHYFRYTVQGQSVNGNKYIEGDQINDLDLYSNNALVLTENVVISTMGSTPEVILFTNVGDVENSLSRNKDLIVDAKKAVVQHPIYADKSKKYHSSQSKENGKVCLENERLCVNDSALQGLNITSAKKLVNNKHLILTNDDTTEFRFITDEKGRFKIDKGSCSSLNDNFKEAQRGVVEFELDLSSQIYEGCYLVFEDQSRNLTEVAITTFKVDAIKPSISNVVWKRGLQSGVRDSGGNSPYFYITHADNLSLIFDVSDNDDNYIKTTFFEKCRYKSSELIDSNSGNHEIKFQDIQKDGWYGDCRFYVTDNASNQSDPISLTGFVLDTKPPEGEIVKNVSRYTNNQQPVFTINSNEELIFEDYVNCNQELIDQINNASPNYKNIKKLFNEKNTYEAIKDHVYEIPIRIQNNLSEQEYHCTLRTRDLAGNTKEYSLENFTVDVTVPNVDNVTDAEGNVVNNEGIQIKLTNKQLDVKFDDIILALCQL